MASKKKIQKIASSERVFNLEKAIKELDGKAFQGSDLLRRLKDVRAEHYRELPIEFDVDDLYSMICRRGWLTETQAGLLRVKIKEQTPLQKLRSGMTEKEQLIHDAEVRGYCRGLKKAAAVMHDRATNIKKKDPCSADELFSQAAFFDRWADRKVEETGC